MITWLVYNNETGVCAVDTVVRMICYGNTDVIIQLANREDALAFRFNCHKNAVRFMNKSVRKGYINTTGKAPRGYVASAVVNFDEDTTNSDEESKKEDEDNEHE